MQKQPPKHFHIFVVKFFIPLVHQYVLVSSNTIFKSTKINFLCLYSVQKKGNNGQFIVLFLLIRSQFSLLL